MFLNHNIQQFVDHIFYVKLEKLTYAHSIFYLNHFNTLVANLNAIMELPPLPLSRVAGWG